MTDNGMIHRFCSPAAVAGGTAFMLGVFGVLTIASSRSGDAAPDPLLLKQVFFLFCGLSLMLLSAAVPFRFYRKHVRLLGGTGAAALLILPWCGVRINGMCGWFRVGALSLQPSELMKAPFLLALAVLLAGRDRSEFRRFALAGAWTLLWLIPVAMQPDFGTAAIYLGVFMLLYFVAAGNPACLLIPAFGGLMSAALFVWRHPYAWRRLQGFLHPEGDPLGSGWHARQFELAVARGHYFGAKLGGAVWSNNYLPFSYNDSAFATLLETLGLAGGILTVALVGVMAAALLRLAFRTERATERIFMIGAVLLLLFQSLIHISVNLCLIPTTGLTMPFVSYGGSSLIGCFILTGMALSAGRESGGDD